MKTHEQRPEQSSQQIPAQRKDRSLPVRDNRPESATQSQLFATVRSGQPSPLVSLVGQRRASHSPAMIQKKGVVQRGGWTDSLTVQCANREAAIWAAAFIVKLEYGQFLVKTLKQQGIKIYSTIEDNRLIVTFFGEKPPFNIAWFKTAKQYINTYATMPKKQLITSPGKANKKEPTMFGKIHAQNNFQSVKNQNIITQLPVKEKKGSTLYLVGQGLFAVGTGDEFPGGFFTYGAGPCVAIAIKCENGVFALGHFDSDVNGGENEKDPYDEKKIDDAIQRLYGLMKEKNHNSDDWGQVEVVLTRTSSWDRNLYDIYMKSIANHFGYVISQKMDVDGAYVSGKEINGVKNNENNNVYTNSLKDKTPVGNLTFMNNLYAQSPQFNSEGINSLIKLVTDLTFHTGENVQEIITKNVNYVLNIVLAAGQEDLQYGSVAGLDALHKEAKKEIQDKRLILSEKIKKVGLLEIDINLQSSGLKTLIQDTRIKIEKNQKIQDNIKKIQFTIQDIQDIIQDIQLTIQRIQIWPILIKKKLLKYSNQHTTLLENNNKIAEDINNICTNWDNVLITSAKDTLVKVKKLEEEVKKLKEEVKKKNVAAKKPTNVFPPKLKK